LTFSLITSTPGGRSPARDHDFEFFAQADRGLFRQKDFSKKKKLRQSLIKSRVFFVRVGQQCKQHLSYDTIIGREISYVISVSEISVWVFFKIPTQANLEFA
jgi:hypothetical protein